MMYIWSCQPWFRRLVRLTLEAKPDILSIKFIDFKEKIITNNKTMRKN